jgi:hypothetical protein
VQISFLLTVLAHQIVERMEDGPRAQKQLSHDHDKMMARTRTHHAGSANQTSQILHNAREHFAQGIENGLSRRPRFPSQEVIGIREQCSKKLKERRSSIPPIEGGGRKVR